MNLNSVISTIVATAKSDINKAALPLLAAFFTSIASNPSALNITAQLAKLQADLIAALPGIEQEILSGIAQQISAQAQAALAPAKT